MALSYYLHIKITTPGANNRIITKTKTSTWNSPLFLVPKKDKSWRPVSDFRALNKQLEDVYFPIPFITDLLDSLHGTKFFSSVDLRSGFYNIELDEDSTGCTAFSALGQTYKYLRLPQGIKSSPIIFQQIMTELFHDDPSCKVYMDDVLVASKTETEAMMVRANFEPLQNEQTIATFSHA